MRIELLSQATGRSCAVAPKAFGKLLHLAQFHGWEPERLDGEWPTTTWNTEIVLPHIGPYMTGVVSKADADSLANALARVIESESSGLDQRLYFAALGLMEIAKDGEFDVRMDSAEAMP